MQPKGMSLECDLDAVAAAAGTAARRHMLELAGGDAGLRRRGPRALLQFLAGLGAPPHCLLSAHHCARAHSSSLPSHLTDQAGQVIHRVCKPLFLEFLE